MKFAVGYQLTESGDEPFVDLVRDYKDQIAEVYFPWADMPSGRAPLSSRRGYTNWAAQHQLEKDLRTLRDMGIGLDLLFNASCYGAKAASQFLENKVLSLLDYLDDLAGGVDTVTTTSLAVARTVKQNFPGVEVRASVNMRIGTVQGMGYVADLFDGYYVQRELNRDLAAIHRLKAWADAHDKKLYILANSGCLAYCSGQTFHDNLVAHEQEIDETANIEDWNPHVCWNNLRERKNWPIVLQSTWIRPEDLHNYDDLFPVVKLATRMHSRPRMVLQAYCERKFRGNLLDLFEPGYSPAFHPHVIDNEKFPDDWFERTSSCGRLCETCEYCGKVLDDVLREMPTD
jgi:collagenase-like PrtC family protease